MGNNNGKLVVAIDHIDNFMIFHYMQMEMVGY